MILGGLFLLWKSTQEIWDSLEGAEEGEHQVKVSSSYYFAMAFSVGVEMLNIRRRKKRAKPVTLHGPKASME